MDFDIFGRSVTDRVSNQKTYYYATSNNLCFCITPLPRKTEKHENAFSLKCRISALPEFNQLFDFFNLFDSRLILTILYDSLNHIINAFSPQSCWGHGSGKRKSRALQELDCVARAQCTSALSSEFPISQGNAEALERWSGKTKHYLISYFFCNTSAKNYRNRNCICQDYSKSKVGRFLRHGACTVILCALSSFAWRQHYALCSWRQIPVC